MCIRDRTVREESQRSNSRNQPPRHKLLATQRSESQIRNSQPVKAPQILSRARTPVNDRREKVIEPQPMTHQPASKPHILVINNFPLSHIDQNSGENMNRVQVDAQKPKTNVQITANVSKLLESFNHHMGALCRVCAYANFRITRYKCLQCHRYDLCANCFESRKYSGSHTWEHLMIPINDPLSEREEAELEKSLADRTFIAKANKPHRKRLCGVCRTTPIYGIRLSCDVCTGFDVCWRCYNEQAQAIRYHHHQHPFVVYLSPVNLVDGPEDVEINQKISEGGFGIVYKGKVRSTDQVAAIKRMTMQLHSGQGTGIAEQFLTEVRAYADLNSTYLVKFLGCYTVVSGELEGLPELRYYILTEFMDNGSMRDVINKQTPLDLYTKFTMMHQVIKGLRRIHSKNYIHKDIKPENIFISRNFEAKIGDMGLMVQHMPGQFNSLGGTLLYMAPELLHWMNYGAGIYDPSVDMYSFALVFHEFFSYFPLTEHGYKETPFFLGILRACLDVPQNRPTAWDVDKSFDEFSDFFWRNVGGFERYQALDLDERNDIFVRSYEIMYNTRIFGI
eukprot:TRINITY_DN5348_c0_g1_i6.p1 TRINITY_DN5348_c0_g1~~TRINITY_DN5348_c0_g1_i6.p1  ORF type:complete len:563 (+),score=61.40 TRINITY_DN5348_c0_g1_i6:80-1768(+)